MTTLGPDDEPTLASIRYVGLSAIPDVYMCGCQHLRGKQWHLCQYHQGFSDGFDAAAENARLRVAASGVSEQAETGPQ